MRGRKGSPDYLRVIFGDHVEFSEFRQGTVWCRLMITDVTHSQGIMLPLLMNSRRRFGTIKPLNW